MSWRWLIVGLAAAALIGAVGWRLVAPSPPEATLTRILSSGVIRVGYAVEPPYAYLDTHGKLTGLEVEVARLIAARLGIPRVDWYQTEFGSLIADLETGRFDAVAAGMFITAERARRASFSEPTFRVHQGLLVQAGNPHGLHAYHDLSTRPGIRIAVLHGSIEEAMVRQAGVPESQIVVVPDALTGRVAVESGLVGGLALSTPTIRFMASQHALGLTEMAAPFSAPVRTGRSLTGFGAVVFAKASDDLRRAWNRELEAFVGGAEHRRLLADFGFSESELPSGVTTAEVLASEDR